jgi:hypothetical protein
MMTAGNICLINPFDGIRCNSVVREVKCYLHVENVYLKSSPAHKLAVIISWRLCRYCNDSNVSQKFIFQ